MSYSGLQSRNTDRKGKDTVVHLRRREDLANSRPVERREQRGAALIEFALLLPAFAALIFGMFSGGLAYNDKIEITNAAREAARYGATVPSAQCTPVANCGGSTWAQLVQSLAVQRSNGALTTSTVCVALVSGSGTSPVPVDASHTTNGSYCFVDNSADSGRRVQVLVTRTDKLQAILFTSSLTLKSTATARFEA